MNTTDLTPLPARPNLEQYKKQAKEFAKNCAAADDATLQRARKYHPHPDRLVASGKCALADAQLVLAREHGFESWPKFAAHLNALASATSPVSNFEAAADAIVTGDTATLARLLRESPNLVHERSMRVHGAMLIHYVGANGFENYRQKTPPNIVEITHMLLDAGAEVDAMADTYGKGTALGLVATSVHPLLAGVQIALLETLLDAGASVDGLPGGWNPLVAALHNGRGQAATFLAERGAKLDLEGAAGVGRLDVVQSFVDRDGTLKAGATGEQLNYGFAWACEYGRTEIVKYLLDAGMAIDTKLVHHGQTGLHWAAYGGHAEAVRLLLERGAPLEIADESFGSTPLGWALHGWAYPGGEGDREGCYEVVALLSRAGARAERYLPEYESKLRKDRRMAAALKGDL